MSKLSNTAAENAVTIIPKIDSPRDLLSDAYKFVTCWLEVEALGSRVRFAPPATFQFLSNIEGIDSARTITLEQAAEMAASDYERLLSVYHNDRSNPRIRSVVKHLKTALMRYVWEVENIELHRRRETLRHDPSLADANLDLELLEILKGKGQVTDLDRLALKQWIWNFKRKLFGLESRWQQLLVLFSAQASGKSLLFERLRQTLVPTHTVMKPLRDMLSDRNLIIFSQHYLVLLDEMASADRACIESFKDLITKHEYNPTRLYSQSFAAEKMRSMMIGSSNKDISEIIKDPTGMRRFYQLKLLPRLDLEAVKAFDFVALVRSIDENDDIGFIHRDNGSTTEEQMIEYTNEYVIKDDFQTFIEDVGLKPPADADDVEDVSCMMLFSEYLSHSRQRNNSYQLREEIFGKRMASLGIKRHRITIEGKRVYVYKISKENTLTETRMENRSMSIVPLIKVGAK